MYRRLYYLLPSVAKTEALVNQLLLDRVEFGKIHVLAKENTPLGRLPEASAFQKNDIKRSFFIGAFIGLFLGALAGIALHQALYLPMGGIMILTTLGGAVLGAWFATMYGLIMPNKELRPFKDAIENGEILVMIDIEKRRIDEIEKDIERLLPEAHFQGMEPRIPSFP
ncbi:MAG: DUF1269 domain-containing protein [Proteobacteria bacterium]|nr:DUF1269 domain-containing protein [Pseudomonadota bacterium]